MKLRIRSLESNQTHKIEIPNTFNLNQLKQFIIFQLFPSQSSTLQSNNLLLSLNKKHELFASLPEQSIVSLGVTSGDLIYFTLNPNLLITQKVDETLGIDTRNDELGKLGNPNFGNCDLVSSQGGQAGVSDKFVGSSDENRVLVDTQMDGSNPNDDNYDLVDPQMVKLGVSDEFVGSNDGNQVLVDTQMDGMSKLSNLNDDNCDLVNVQRVKLDASDEFVGSSDGNRVLVEGMSKLSNPNDGDCDLVNVQRVKSGVSDEFVGSSDGNRVLVEGMSKLSNPSDHSEAQMMESEKSGEGDASNAQGRESIGDKMKGELELRNHDEMEVDNESLSDVNTRFSVPGFLKNVYVKEVGVAADNAANGGNHKLLVIAVHAVLFEAGFVGYDPVAGRKVDGFHLSDEWPSSAFGISLHYTLPEISSSEVVETVVLKFRTLGKYVNVYGSLDSFSRKGYGTHRVCLDESRFIPALSYVWKMGDYTDSEKRSDGYPNRELFEFWKTVKDGLSYPLLIELCEHAGLLPPPCFMLLPTDLKLKILETLPAVDVAKVACVCSELNFVASNNDLWKLKYEEEFGDVTSSQREIQWKSKFASAWDIRKKRKRVCVPFQWREPPHFRPLFPGRRDPNLLGIPFVFGGDYDRIPAFGMPLPPGRRIFRRDCDLGGFGV